MKYFTIGVQIILLFAVSNQVKRQNITIADLPATIQPYIRQVEIDYMGASKPSIRINFIDYHTLYIGIAVDLKEDIQMDDWKVKVHPAFKPDFFWTPHLTPDDGYIVAQHVFRSPAL